MIIDDEVWVETEEPRYVILTFGAGNNQAETCLAIKSDSSKENSFSPWEYNEAIKKCLDVAMSRGDTDSVSGIKAFRPIEIFPHPHI